MKVYGFAFDFIRFNVDIGKDGHRISMQGDTFMKRLFKILLSAVWVWLMVVNPVSARAAFVDIITVEGSITPVKLKYISDHIDMAVRDGAECLIIRMDTPGGLLQSTFEIDKKILAAAVPVIVYISPSGGRAASAGVFISYAAHRVYMAPSTNIGSATPVTMGGQDSSGVMMEKVTNDAVAHIKGLADRRQRNAEWAEKAVRERVNITDKEALELGVIDGIAGSLDNILAALDGQAIDTAEGRKILDTDGADLRFRPLSLRYKILDKIADPNIAYLLMILGFYGIFFELRSPGAVFPGIFGAISLVLAFFAMQVLSINVAGLLLIVLAILFWILEAFTPTFGLLTTGGVVAFIIGSMMLYETPEVKVSMGLIISLAVCTVLFLAVGLALSLRTRMTRATTGEQGLIGAVGTVVKTLNPEGQVSVRGEVWKAASSGKIQKGERVRVTGVEGLILRVQKSSDM